MKLRLLAATVAALTLTAGLAVAQDTTSEKGKLSYYFGYDFGRNLAESGEPVDVATLVKAVQDGYAKKAPAVPTELLRPAVEVPSRDAGDPPSSQGRATNVFQFPHRRHRPDHSVVSCWQAVQTYGTTTRFLN